MYNTMLMEQDNVANHEGARAYAMTPELELYTAVVTAALSDNFYESKDERVNRIAELVDKVSPEFVAKLAVYTRTVMNLRTIPMLLLVELARVHNGDDLVARAVEQTVQRADEIMELLMCYQWRNPSADPRKKLGKLSRQIQNGLQRAFNRFDEYQFAKYNRGNLKVKLRDALFLTHPKAKDEGQQHLFDKIVSGTLETPYTWETELTALGQRQFGSEEERREAVRTKWEELIDSGKLGYMALMRNLRNMLQAGVQFPAMLKVAGRLSDPEQVEKSRQLPFRFLSAYREVSGVESPMTNMVLNALETAVKHTAANIEGFGPDTRVLIASDVSGSMHFPISRNSTVMNYDIGLLLSMLLKSRCRQVVSGIFGSDWKVVNMPSDNILSSTVQLHKLSNSVGFGTNAFNVFDWLIVNSVETGEIVDKVFFFTDMQMWDLTGDNRSLLKMWGKYKKKSPGAKLYLFDLAGYGQMPLRLVRPDIWLVAGWNERVFGVLEAIEKGEDAIDVINKIEI